MGCVQSKQPVISSPRNSAYAITDKKPAVARPPAAEHSLWAIVLGFIAKWRPWKDEGKKFTREQCSLIQTYLPKYPYLEPSTNAHKEIAAKHWLNSYRDEKSTTSANTKRNSFGGSTIGQLYDMFYSHLSEHEPELMPIFRSSLHVRSRVLVHISVGMRSILTSSDVTETILTLTRTHIKAGVQLTHYQPLADCLFHAMAKTSGELWTPEVADAWQHLYVHCSAFLMVEHQRQRKKLSKVERQLQNGTLNVKSTTPSDTESRDLGTFSVPRGYTGLPRGSRVCTSVGEEQAVPAKRNSTVTPSRVVLE